MKRLISILLLLIFTMLITLSGAASTDNYKYTETVEYSIEFSDKTGFFIKNPVGSIDVQAWPESRIEITAVKRAKREEILDEVGISIKESKIGAEIRFYPYHLFEPTNFDGYLPAHRIKNYPVDTDKMAALLGREPPRNRTF